MFFFLPVTLLLYYVLPKSCRNFLLLILSLLFYTWGEGRLVLIMVLSITINYFFGLAVNAARNNVGFQRRIILFIGIAANLLLLGYYKYFDFAAGIFNATLHTEIALRDIALPIGISFFTFQGLTYLIDLYRGDARIQKNPLKVALYIAFFPALIAGPIVRYRDIADQIDQRQTTLDLFHSGTARFIMGLGKKVIIANNVGLIADSIFNAPVETSSVLTAWIGALCYMLQIYFDFSGYSDMAIGIARMFGFNFKENFNYPYISSSIREFWRRWHISLSSFFRDYLYIPLGGNRRGNVYVNLLIVFIATGLWHGAGYTFLIWGLWHGLFIVLENVVRKHPSATRFFSKFPVLSRPYTLFVVLIGWVIFRSDSIGYAGAYLRNMFGLQTGTDVIVSGLYYLDGFNVFVIVLAIALSVPLYPKLKAVIKIPVLGTAGLCALLIVSALLIINQNYSPFLYFRF